MPRKKKGKSPSSAKSSQATRPAHYDIEMVRSYARGQWARILSTLGNLSPDVMDPRQHFPCPKCGGTDRFRVFADFSETGGCICNQCFRVGKSGFDTLIWLTGKTFAEVLAMVAGDLGIAPSNADANYKANGRDHSDGSDPAEFLQFQEWDESGDLLAGYWCLTKKPITLAAIKLCGGKLARYSHFDREFSVIALPVWGEQLTAAAPVGWSLYNATGAGLPGPGGKWIKVKLTHGSNKPGIIGPVDRLAAATEVWKLEGPSDLLAFWSLADIPPNVAAITNKAGCGEKPANWIVSLLAGKRVKVLHDADVPGQEGAVGKRDSRGLWTPGWIEAVSCHASETYHVQLPYDVVPNHGKDLRDYLLEKCNGN